MDNTPNFTQNEPAGGGAGNPPLTEQAKNAVSEVAQQTRQQAGDLVNQARDQVRTQISSQKDALAGGVGSLAQALRQSSGQLQGQEQALVAPVIDRAAQVAEGLSGYLQEHSLEDLVGEVESFARREPVLFLGGAFALGFVAARFLKTSSAPSGNGSRGGQSEFQSQHGIQYGSDYSSLDSLRYGPGTGATTGTGTSGRSGLETGGPIETAGGSIWTGDGPANDPRGRRLITGGEAQAALPEDSDEYDDSYSTSSASRE